MTPAQTLTLRPAPHHAGLHLAVDPDTRQHLVDELVAFGWDTPAAEELAAIHLERVTPVTLQVAQ